MTGIDNESMQTAFATMVPELIHEFLAEFNPQIDKRSDYEIVAELEYCQVGIVLDTGLIGIWLSPSRKECDVPPKEIGLGWVLEYLGLSEQKKIDWVRTPEQMRALLVDQLATLIEFCKPILYGEFSQWSELDESAVERATGFWERMDQIWLVGRVREQALIADKQEHYAQVIKLFESIPDQDIRPPDRRLLEKARMRLAQ